MATKINAAKLVNTVSYETDLASLKKVKNDLKDLKKQMQGRGKLSPRATQDLVRDTRRTAKKIKKVEDDIHSKDKKVRKQSRKRMLKETVENREALATALRRKTLKDWSKDERIKSRLDAKSNAQELKRVAQDEKLKQKAREAIQKRWDTRKQTRKVRDEKQALADARRQARIARLTTAMAKRRVAQNLRRDETADVGSIRFNGAQSRLGSSLSRANSARFSSDFQKLNSKLKSGEISIRSYNAQLAQMTARMNSAASAGRGLASTIRNVRGGYLLAGATIGFGTAAIVKNGMEFENLGVKMNSAFGDKAQEEIQYVKDQAEELGISFKETVSEYAKIAAVVQEDGGNTDRARKIFRSVASSAKIWGLDGYETNLIYKAIGQMYGKGQVTSEELRGQLAERLYNATKLMSESEKVPVKELLKLIELGKVREPELDKFIDKLQEFADPRLQAAINTTESNMQRFFNTFAEAGKSLWEEGGIQEAFNGILLNAKWLTNKNSPLLYLGRIVTGAITNVIDGIATGVAQFADLMVKFKVFKDPATTKEFFSLNTDWDKGFLDFIDTKFPQFSDEFRKFFDAEGMDKLKAFGDILSAVWKDTTKDAFPNLKQFINNVDAVVTAMAKVSKMLLAVAESPAIELMAKIVGKGAENINETVENATSMYENAKKGNFSDALGDAFSIALPKSSWVRSTVSSNWEKGENTYEKQRLNTLLTLTNNLLTTVTGSALKSQASLHPVGLSPIAKSVIEVKLQLNDNALDVMMAKITGDLVSTITTK